MERRDILVIAAALIVVLILAVVVKPMLTHQAPNLGLPQTPAPPVPVEQSSSEPGVITGPTEIELTPEPTPVKTLTSTTNEPISSGSQKMQPLPALTPVSWQPDADNPMPAVQMVNYADIVGKYTGTTAPFRIPTPYWEIAYNITPSGSTPVFLLDVVEKGVSGENKTIRSMVYRQGKQPDPKEGRFFEGGHDYYLNITADQIEKYRIILSIPLKYLPDQ
ncbi:hypothetical protein [Methanospirillum lacunae]|uniref:Uncharacterized protein n=1 Tax=Methanospirillum lacunae TaxID=668570 RepID=A0A2V2N1V1_9EURY|nr:hypothetical protein [Methanospirillum lacunae]PWR74082.1 hypothetical protein DK846_02685 [Methanospirillum lacunae]